jgi:hypothetical protein
MYYCDEKQFFKKPCVMKPKTVIIIKNQSASSENIFFKGQHIKCRKKSIILLKFPPPCKYYYCPRRQKAKRKETKLWKTRSAKPNAIARTATRGCIAT